MSRRKHAVPSRRVRLDGFIRCPVADPREEKALGWYDDMRVKRQAFPIAWSFIVAAVNGELGPRVEAAVQDGNTEETLEALQDLLGAFRG